MLDFKGIRDVKSLEMFDRITKVGNMKRLNHSFKTWTTVFCMSALLLTACGGVTEEMAAARESAIAMMENGDYEGAAAAFNALVAEAKSVTDFELDILKYRAEAEYKLGDYAAAAYTYDILNQVDAERTEYCYFGAMSLAKAGDIAGAQELLEKGKLLDQEEDEGTMSVGYVEAVMALGNAMFDSGDKTGANVLYDELIASGCATTEIYNRLMTDAMASGNYETALGLAERGLQLEDGLAEKQLKFNEAVCYEYLGNWSKALSMFEAYVAEYGSDEKAEHEIAFLRTR